MSHTLHVLSLVFVLFVFLCFTYAGFETWWLIPRRERKRAARHPGPLPEETFARFTEPHGCCDLPQQPDTTPTVEALERLAALPEVEPERRRQRPTYRQET